MDTNFLRTLLMVVDSGSIAEAARLERLTPASVAQRIRVLENQIGHRLIERSGRVVRPTAAALGILARSRGILRDVDELHSLASGQRLTGQLRLGAVATVMTGMVPALMEHMTQAAPDVDHAVQPGFSGELYSLVLNGTLDAAIIVRPPFEIAPSCGIERLRREALIAVAGPDHVGADPLELLRREPFIRADRTRWMGSQAEAYMAEHTIRPRLRFEANALDLIVLLVTRGLGVSLIPDALQPWPLGASVARIQLPNAPQREIVVVWSRDPGRAHLVELLRAALRELPPSIRNL
ncbi:LysR family transcriptional regulator [Frigidibacter sp. MR17.24]|uniref:LysR family transcriptional regulator n=1 Tax=Frigidibacter sp. MR17.24 TaxID=3127345 RepID=UPI003012E39E